MAKQRKLTVKSIGGQIVEDTKVLCNPNFSNLSVWADEGLVNIDLENDEGEYKDSYVNITMTIDDAELLIFLLQQKINSVRSALDN